MFEEEINSTIHHITEGINQKIYSIIKMPKRSKIVKGAQELYRNSCVDTLTSSSRIFLVGSIQTKKEEFTNWVKQIYEELITISISEIIMKIVACSAKLIIIYMPEHSNAEDIKNTGKSNIIVDGVTYGRVEQIIIAAKDYTHESHRNRLKGLIIHEFCHFCAYETFCNAYKGYYPDNNDHEKIWMNVVKECEKEKNHATVIEEAFNYGEESCHMELVVRYFQFQIEYHSDKEKLKKFSETYPSLCEVCKSNVLVSFCEEYEKINAIRGINQAVTQDDNNSPYRIEAVRNKREIKFSQHVSVVRTNDTSLMANHIFYTFEKLENFKAKYVFLNINYLLDDKNFEKFLTALQRRNNPIFVIDCFHKRFNEITLKLKFQIEKFTSPFFVLLFDQNQEFDDFGSEIQITFTPNDLTDAFIENIKLNFQGCKTSIKNLISTSEDFRTLGTLPKEKLHKDEVSIGNQMDYKVCEYYVYRSYMIKTVGEWKDLDNIEDIFENNMKVRRILVENQSGAGKSIESVELYYRYKKKYPYHWIVHINLSRLHKILENETFKNLSLISATCSKFFKLNSFEAELFKYMMKAGQMILIFDSLDEILPRYSENFKAFAELIFLINRKQRILIFTRPYQHCNTVDRIMFIRLKMNELDEGLMNTLKNKYIGFNHPKMSHEERDIFKAKIYWFLNENNFTSPHLMTMALDHFSVSTMRSNEYCTIDNFNVFNGFMTSLWKITDEKNGYIHENISELDDFHKYFQKLAIERLILSQNNSKQKYTRMSQRDLENYLNNYIFDTINSSEQILQRFGVIFFDEKTNIYRFDKTSFENFYVAKFIMDKNLSDHASHHFLLELLSILIAENRLESVITFLKSSKVFLKNLIEYDVLYQMLTQIIVASADDHVNIMPIAEYLVNIVSNHANLNRICIQNGIYLSTIQFSDPIKMLMRIYAVKKNSWKSWKSWKMYVNENVLMNKNYLNTHLFDNDNTKNSASSSINIVDVLGYCGILK